MNPTISMLWFLLFLLYIWVGQILKWHFEEGLHFMVSLCFSSILLYIKFVITFCNKHDIIILTAILYWLCHTILINTWLRQWFTEQKYTLDLEKGVLWRWESPGLVVKVKDLLDSFKCELIASLPGWLTSVWELAYCRFEPKTNCLLLLDSLILIDILFSFHHFYWKELLRTILYDCCT